MQKDLAIAGAPAYHSYPDAVGRHPGLVLIEEIWGVNAHIRNVADRLAQEGFSVLSPELLPLGVLQALTPQTAQDLFDPAKREEVQPKVRAAMAPTQQPEYAAGAIATLKACVDYLLADAGVNGKVGVMGFCFGGTYSFHLAAHDARLRAAVPFYGHSPSGEEVENISCPVLAFYGEDDANIMPTLPALKEAMRAAGAQFEAVVYSGVGHAFFNDTNPRTYNASAAAEAWEKALAFLRTHLAG